MPRRSGDWWLGTSYSQLIPNPCLQTSGGGFAAQKRKPTPPRCARQPLPREGACVDTPSFLWKEVPRRGGGWMGEQDERSEGRSFQLRRLRQYPNTAQRLLSGHCPKCGKEGSARRFAWPLISPKILIKILIKILAMDPLLCYNTESAGMARLF